VIRTKALDPAPRARRRDLLRIGFLSATALAATELAATFAPFMRVNRIVGLGASIALTQTKAEILQRFAATNDEPILFAQERFFLVHAPAGVVAAYRRCTHLGCAVPYAKSEDRFHCPCHQSIYDKHTALVIGGPAPRGLDLFHLREEAGKLVVDTNPLNLMVRSDNKWHPEHVEVPDQI
jgi:cytochrome b6-f complex iron-sulfur subunit